jgi:hypothetical protein
MEREQTDIVNRLRHKHSDRDAEAHDLAADEIERLRGLLLAALEGLEFPKPDWWMATDPHIMRLTCQAVAKQAKQAADQPAAAPSADQVIANARAIVSRYDERNADQQAASCTSAEGKLVQHADKSSDTPARGLHFDED